MIWNIIIGYTVGFVAITVAFRLMLRSEPTAHGQIVGTQIGCIVALFWPIALPYFALIGTGALIYKAWKRLKGD